MSWGAEWVGGYHRESGHNREAHSDYLNLFKSIPLKTKAHPVPRNGGSFKIKNPKDTKNGHPSPPIGLILAGFASPSGGSTCLLLITILGQLNRDKSHLQ